MGLRHLGMGYLLYPWIRTRLGESIERFALLQHALTHDHIEPSFGSRPLNRLPHGLPTAAGTQVPKPKNRGAWCGDYCEPVSYKNFSRTAIFLACGIS